MAQHHIDVQVSKRAFRDNIRYVKELVAPAKVCVVMKANAYGHGLEALAPVAVEAGADVIGICTNPEAETVRGLGLTIPLLRLRMALPEELDEALDGLDVEEQVGGIEQATYLDEGARRRKKKVPVHVNLDTGMGRSGFLPRDVATLKEICALPGLEIRGVMTHFASADGSNLDFTGRQIARFEEMLAQFLDVLPVGVLSHTHNSAATVRLGPKHTGSARAGELVRVGAACYGVRTSTDFENPHALKPVMSVRTRVAQVRDIPAGFTIGYSSLFETKRASRIASLPVGFGEGYPRSLFNKGIVLIGGQRCPVVGRVSLNITTVDVTDVPTPVKWGDEAVLVGNQGDAAMTFEELADKFSSVHTEINLSAGFMNRIRYLD
ncbi:MAG TPA: alanine racemase [Polyangiaceae bacterium]|jgi:alanine racemase|nr:alanine racemase [Polyangiaceae bacterium]